ncbi:MAG: peptidylprolyl isomerase [Pseudomonadota bacterium]
MKKNKFLSIAVFISLLCSAISFSVSASAQDENKVIAKVNGQSITEKDFRFAQIEIGSEISNIPEQQRRLVLLEYLIENQLLSQAAKDNKVDQDKDFSDQLKYYQKRALRNIYFDKYVRQSVTDEEAKKVYNQQIKAITPQEEVRASHILVKTEKEAKEISEQLKKGSDFAKLAAEKSIGPSKAKGGDLGFFSKDRMVRPFAEAAFKLKKGETSEPVKTEFGWHLIKLQERRTRPLPKFEAIKDRLKASLLQQKAQSAVETLRKKAEINILDKGLDSKMKEVRGSISAQPQPEKKKEEEKKKE